MPSFDRLLIFSVLALSVSVLSAPVGADSSHSISLTERGLVPAPGVIQRDILPEQSANVGGVLTSDDVDDHNSDEQNTHHNDEYAGSHHRRAATTTTGRTTSKPKPTKVASPKSTKAKTATKATPTRHAKSTKVKTTAKPTKSAKITTKPAKTTKTSSPASKASNVAGAAKPSACPVKKPAKKPRDLTSRAYDYIAHLFARDSAEFVGWHGTNSATAALWKASGYIKKPTKGVNVNDYLPSTSKEGKGGKGSSGGDAELGPGLYVTDVQLTAIGFAVTNSQTNPGTQPALCAIYAKSSVKWRDSVHKAFIPENLVHDAEETDQSEEFEKARVKYIKYAMPDWDPKSLVRFSQLDRTKDTTGQLLIPESLATQFSARCFKVEGGAVAKSDAVASTRDTRDWPEFEYRGDALRRDWRIMPENPRGSGC